jgi:hypothetical protein
MGQAFQRFGCQVTVLEYGSHFLPREDPDAAALYVNPNPNPDAAALNVNQQSTLVLGNQFPCMFRVFLLFWGFWFHLFLSLHLWGPHLFNFSAVGRLFSVPLWLTMPLALQQQQLQQQQQHLYRVKESLEADGIIMHQNVRFVRVERAAGGDDGCHMCDFKKYTVVTTIDGKEVTFTADAILNGTGESFGHHPYTYPYQRRPHQFRV